ncbi:hypothetical protein J6590_039083 [Homalodisca vitripennis]|nr:hypothetical protein J6590_039083 [Homalodisca vitripennis]
MEISHWVSVVIATLVSKISSRVRTVPTAGTDADCLPTSVYTPSLRATSLFGQTIISTSSIVSRTIWGSESIIGHLTSLLRSTNKIVNFGELNKGKLMRNTHAQKYEALNTHEQSSRDSNVSSPTVSSAYQQISKHFLCLCQAVVQRLQTTVTDFTLGTKTVRYHSLCARVIVPQLSLSAVNDILSLSSSSSGDRDAPRHHTTPVSYTVLLHCAVFFVLYKNTIAPLNSTLKSTCSATDVVDSEAELGKSEFHRLSQDEPPWGSLPPLPTLGAGPNVHSVHYANPE